MKCLSEYACNQLQLDIAMEAIQLIRRCAKYVHDHIDRFSGDEEDREGGRIWIRGWFPVLFELSCIINRQVNKKGVLRSFVKDDCFYYRSNLDIRTRSLTILFDIVKQYGGSFEDNWWRDLFGVVFRIFASRQPLGSGSSVASTPVDSPHHHVQPREQQQQRRQQQQDREWMDTTCNHALYAATDVFNEFFSRLQPLLLPELLAQYQWCLSRGNEQLSRSALACLENLSATNRHLMTAETERLVVHFLSDVVLATATNAESGRVAVSIHLEVLSATGRLVRGGGGADSSFVANTDADSERHAALMQLVDSLLVSFAEGADSVQKALENAALPLLIRQETMAFEGALSILLELYHDQLAETHRSETQARMLNLLSDGLSHFLRTTLKSQRDAWSDLLARTFEEILNFPDCKFRQTVCVLYPNVCDVLAAHTTSREFRQVLCKVLKRVGHMYGITEE